MAGIDNAAAGKLRAGRVQFRKIQGFVPVPGMDQVRAAGNGILEQGHVPAIPPVGGQHPNQGKGPLRPVRHGAARAGQGVIAPVAMEPHDIFPRGDAIDYLGPFAYVFRGQIARLLPRQGQPFPPPGMQIIAGITGDANHVHPPGDASVGQKGVGRAFVLPIPVPFFPKPGNHAAVGLNGPPGLVQPAGAVFHGKNPFR